MTTAAVIVHSLAGRPKLEGFVDMEPFACWVCASRSTRGMLANRWSGANFTDQNKARCQSSTHVCEACAWSCSWVQPPGMPEPAEGKKGLNLRLFSHLHDERGYIALNKASKPAILKWLREPKQGEWFAAIADTGQKHVLPWTPINVSQRGVVRFEERNIALPSAEGWSLCDDMRALLTLGVTKDEVIRGDYSVRSQQAHAETIRAFEEQHGARLRGGAWFELSLWLSQRDEEAYEDRRKQAQDADRPDRKSRARVAKAVSEQERREHAEALADDPRPDADVGANDIKRSRVDDSDAGEASTADPGQLSLF